MAIRGSRTLVVAALALRPLASAPRADPASRRLQRKPARPPRGRRSSWSRSTRHAPTPSVRTRSASRRRPSTPSPRAARGSRQAYAAVPETLPSHVSMLTGVFPATHTVHENARPIPATTEVAAERLRKAGYRTAAFVSSFILARQFGLARGFDTYDDALPQAVGRARVARDHRRGASRTWRGPPRSRSSSGSTTSTRTIPTRRRSRIAAGSRASRTWARWPRWTSNSAGSWPRSSSA